jgi:hypothetical protein
MYFVISMLPVAENESREITTHISLVLSNIRCNAQKSISVWAEQPSSIEHLFQFAITRLAKLIQILNKSEIGYFYFRFLIGILII